MTLHVVSYKFCFMIQTSTTFRFC